MAEIEQRERDPRHDLARGITDVVKRGGPFQLWIGGAPVVTDAAIAAVDVQKYELVALVNNQIVRFVPGTHEAKQMVLAAQPVVAGQSLPYWKAGRFNHEAVIWPAGTAFDTYAERQAFLTGTMLMVGHLI